LDIKIANYLDVKVPFQELKGRRGWIAFFNAYMARNSKLKCNRNKEELKQNGREHSNGYGSGARHS